MLPKALKSCQSPINSLIWSYWLERMTSRYYKIFLGLTMTPVKVHSHDVRLTYAASVESCIATEKGIFLIICTTAVCVKHILCDECSLICVNFLGFFCWLGHLKMSFYYPSSHKGRGVVYFLYFNL